MLRQSYKSLIANKISLIVKVKSTLLLMAFYCAVAAPYTVAIALPDSTLPFSSLTTEHGLSHLSTTRMYQDNDGYLWIATLDGLNRYDGKHFSTFYADDDPVYGLYSNSIYDIVTGPDGNVWIMSSAGASYFDLASQQLLKAFPEKMLLPFQGEQVEVLMGPQLLAWQGKFVLLSNYGLLYYQPQSKQFSWVDEHAMQPIVPYIAVIEGSTFWALLDDQLYQSSDLLDFKLVDFTQATPQPFAYPPFLINCLSESHNAVYICADEGVYRIQFNGDIELFDHQRLQFNGKIYDVMVDHQELMWLSTINGLIQFDPQNNAQRLFTHSPFLKQSIVSNDIAQVFEDRGNVVWVGTNNNGVSRLTPSARQFEVYSPNQTNLNQPASSVVKIKQQFEQVLILYASGSVELFDLQGNLQQRLDLPEDFQKLAFAMDVSLDDLGNIWVASSRGLYIWRKALGQFEHIFEVAQGGMYHEFIQHVDWVAGKIMIFTPALGIFERVGGKFQPKFDQYDDELAIGANSARWWVDGDDIWFITYEGQLVHYQLSQHRLTRFTIPDALRQSSVIYTHSSSKQESADTVWIGSDSGLFVWHASDDKQESSVQFAPFDLPKRSIFAISQHENTLWVVYSDRIARINLISNQVEWLDAGQGLPQSQFSGGILAVGDTMLLGTNRSVLQLTNEPKAAAAQINKHNELEAASIAAIDYLPDHSVSGWQRIAQQEWRSGTLTLAPEQQHIRIYIDNLNFDRSLALQFRYQLVGVDKQWQVLDEVGFIEYAALNFGQHEFEFQLSVDGQVWQGLKQPLVIIKQQFWWQYLSVKVLLICAVLLMMALIIRWRFKRIKQRAWLLEQQVSERTQSLETLLEQRNRLFTYISHELKTPLALVLAPLKQSLTLTGQAKDSHVALALKHAQKLNQLIEQLLQITYLPKSDTEQFSHELDAIVAAATEQYRELAQHKGVYLHLDLQSQCVVSGQQSDIELIINNLLSNAIKYSKQGRVDVITHFDALKNTVKLIVRDQGVGIDEALLPHIFTPHMGAHLLKSKLANANNTASKYEIKSHGLGLALVKATVDSLGGQITASKQLQGTVFMVELHAQAMQTQTTLIRPDVEPDAQQPLLLIAEDNLDLANYLKTLFSEQYQVLLAHDGHDALQLSNQYLPDVILSDFKMPRLTGLDFIAALRQQEMTCHIPVIIISANSSPETNLALLAAGANDVIAKPFDPQVLRHKLTNLMQLKPLQIKAKQTEQNDAALEDSESDESDDNAELSPISPQDQLWLTKLAAASQKMLKNEQSSLEDLAELMSISLRQLQRKLKALLHTSPNEYLKQQRLEQAVVLLKQGLTIQQVCVAVGFNSQSYFTTCFKQYFGDTPKQYLQNITEQGPK